MTPLVSVIIPTFNRAHLIGETLDSILAQTYQNWECIIVDDGSTDKTFFVIESYSKKDSRIKGFKRPISKIKGANACRNYGFSMAQGDYCIFFDSDDFMAKTCLEQRVKLFADHQDKDFLVFSMGHFVKLSNCYKDVNRKVINLSINDTLEEFILGGKLPWNVCRPIFKTKLIQNKIFFNEKIQNFQDDEFNIKLLGFLKPKYLSIDITDCYYRIHEESLNRYNSIHGSQNIVNCFFEYYKTIFKVFTNEQKLKYRNRLISKFFYQIYFYLRPGIKTKIISKTIRLFEKELQLSVKERIVINGIVLLNKYYFSKKGYYFIITRMKEIFRC